MDFQSFDSDANSVLVVDDEFLLRLDIAECLQQAGYIVTEAGSADEAIRYVNSGRHFDAIVTDVEMPGAMNGFGLAWAVKLSHPSVGLVIVSGRKRPIEADIPRAARFIAKPCSEAVLLRELSRAIEEVKANGFEPAPRLLAL